MIATADSNNSKIICVINRRLIIIKDKEFPEFPRRVKSRCPAIMLAVSRIAKVPGRIKLLIDSIQTIKGINTLGVPWGIKWANICWVWLNQPKIIKDNQSGKDNVNVKVKWLVLVKI